ncbi:MAG: hypothetical protein HYV26_06300 [Candidatus Hydrogenedentes bacterium]|nr:hypothetical protein [Candidatus Hydrogenedentota bacterium]
MGSVDGEGGEGEEEGVEAEQEAPGGAAGVFATGEPPDKGHWAVGGAEGEAGAEDPEDKPAEEQAAGGVEGEGLDLAVLVEMAVEDDGDGNGCNHEDKKEYYKT